MRTAEKEQSNESVVDRWNRGAVTNRLKIEWNKGEEEEEEEPSLCTGMHQQPPQLKAIDMMVQLRAISWKESSATNHRLNEWWWLASATTFRWERLPASDEKVVSLRCLCKKVKTYFEGRPRITGHRSLWPTSVRLRVWPFNVITMTTSATTSPLLLLLLFLQLIKQLIIRKRQSNCHLDVVRSGAISCNLSQSQDIIILVDKCFSKGKGNKSRWLESHCLDSEKNTIDSTAKLTVCVPVSQMVMRE